MYRKMVRLICLMPILLFSHTSFAQNGSLLAAAQALSSHIKETASLSGTAIAGHYKTIEENKALLDGSPEIVTAFRNLINTYETKYGAFFLPGSEKVSFSRNNETTEDIHWAIFSTMQLIFDEVFNKGGLNDPTIFPLIEGYRFASSAQFPGLCEPPTNPDASHTVKINGSFKKTFGRDTQNWDWPARKPTGTYLAPGTIVKVTVPSVLVGKGYQIRVGAHAYDHEERNRNPVNRFSRISLLFDITNTTMTVANPLGGGIYIEVPSGADAGIVNVTITGAVRSPYFSAKSFHKTSNQEWVNAERGFPAPWADFQSEKFMMQVPRAWIYKLDDPSKLIAEWDASVDAVNDLMGFPRVRGKETIYLQADAILKASVHSPGYPAVNVTTGNPNSGDGYANNYLIRGPQYGSETEFHELGHSYRFPRMAYTNEAEVNLHYVTMANTVYDMDIGKAFFRAYAPGNRITEKQIENTAQYWMIGSLFRNGAEMQSWEETYKPAGYARLVDFGRLFGWEGLGKYWYSFNHDHENGLQSPGNNDGKMVRLCETSGLDIRPLWHFWGKHPQDSAEVRRQVEKLGLKPSRKIYDILNIYKDNFIPANNAEFRAFCQIWFGKEPSLTGIGTENDRAKQLASYNEETADSISSMVQSIIDLYFPEGQPPANIEHNMLPELKYGRAITVFPLLINDSFTVNFNPGVYDMVKIMSLSGREIQSRKIPASKSTLNMNINELNRGKYILMMSGEKTNQAVKIIKE